VGVPHHEEVHLDLLEDVVLHEEGEVRHDVLTLVVCSAVELNVQCLAEEALRSLQVNECAADTLDGVVAVVLVERQTPLSIRTLRLTVHDNARDDEAEKELLVEALGGSVEVRHTCLVLVHVVENCAGVLPRESPGLALVLVVLLALETLCCEMLLLDGDERSVVRGTPDRWIGHLSVELRACGATGESLDSRDDDVRKLIFPELAE
jgi:hypothetical protein